MNPRLWDLLLIDAGADVLHERGLLQPSASLLCAHFLQRMSLILSRRFLSILPLAGLLPALFCLPVSTSEQPGPAASFERLGPFGGEVRSLLIDAKNPNVVYLGTSDGRVFKSLNGGNAWNPLAPGIGKNQYVIDTLVQDPADAAHIYAGAWDLRSTGGGLYESRNAGATWVPVPLPERSPAVRDLAICSEKPACMIAGTLAGAYVSSDGGLSWHAVESPSVDLQKIESVAIDPRDPRFLYVGTWRLGYRSSDFGKTWKMMDQGMMLDSDVFSLCINPRDPEIVYASACTGMYRSTNRASSWLRMRVLPNRFVVRTQVIYVDPSDSHCVYGGTTEGLFVSRDDGRTWSRITPARLTVNAIQVDPANRKKILIGTGSEGILISHDGGRTWAGANQGFVRRQITRIMPDPLVSGRFYAGVAADGREGGFYAYDRKGADWSPLTSGLVSGAQVYCYLTLPARLGRLSGTASGLYWQRFGSRNWTKLGGFIASRRVYDLAVDSAGWILAGTDQGIYRAKTERMQFQLPVSSRFSPRIYSLVVAKTTPPAIYAGSSLGVMRSLDHGQSWQIVSAGIPPRVDVECIALSPSEKGRMFAGTSTGLYETVDGGARWLKAREDRLAVEIASVIFLDFSGKRVLAADSTFGGMFLTEDGGATWSRIEAPGYVSPVRFLAQDAIRPELIYAGTQSDGVYRLRLLDNKLAAPPTHLR